MPPRERIRSLPRAVLRFDERSSPQIVAIPHQKVERAGDRLLIGSAAMQGIELRHAFVIETDHLGIENGNALDARRFLDDARVAVSPVGPVHRIETHPPIAEMDLQPIAVMLEFMRPAGALRGLLGDSWTTWMDEVSRDALRPPTRGTHTPQHAQEYRLSEFRFR